jgi:Zn-dependent metalloprotease
VRTRRLSLATAVSLALTVAAFALGAACSSSQDPGSAPPGTLARLEHDTGVTWGAVKSSRFGTTSYLYPRSSPPVLLDPGTTPTKAAEAFFEKYGEVFQMRDPARELAPEETGISGGLAFASFTEREGPASVHGTRLTVVFDKAGRIAFVSGLFVPNVHGFDTNAAVSAAEALTRAEADMATRYPPSALVALEPTPAPELTIWEREGTPELAYCLLLSYASDTRSDAVARQRVVMSYRVDANSGKILEAVSGLEWQYAGGHAEPMVASGEGQRGGPRRSFPALGTADGLGGATAPYFLQDREMGADSGAKLTSLIFVRTPTETPVLESDDHDANEWDTESTSDPGSAVDAYSYLRQVESWWQIRGRNGYDDHAGELGIIVHDPAVLYGKTPCTNNAYWDHINSVHVCPSSTSFAPHADVAASVDLGFMGHEFQHAVNQFSLDLDGTGQAGAIGESLGDVFGEFITHDEPPNGADCIWGIDWLPGRGARNMVDPHFSATGPQPDSVEDPLYATGDTHKDDGIPNKAWSLATFGGQDETTPEKKVDASLALGWKDSETLYLDLIALRPVSEVASFSDLAYALTGLARAEFGPSSSHETAVACAWYAVGVLSENEMKSSLGIDPCSCSGPSAGECEAGTDAGAGAGAGESGLGEKATPGVHCQVAGDQCFTWLSFSPTEDDAWKEACSKDFKGLLRLSCPTAQLVGCCSVELHGDGGPVGTQEQCFYSPLSASEGTSLCSGVKGVWSAYESEDAGAGDAGRDGEVGDSAPPPHC